MERRKKALICLFLLVSFILPRVKIVKAEALPEVEVMESTATIADMVMTYYAESGSAVTNTDWINTLYNDLGTSFGTVEDLAQQGLLVLNENTGMWESTAELATAIENTSAYASLELNNMFSVSAQEAAELGGGAVAASGGAILASSAAGVASIGLVPLIGAVSASYWAGIGIGTLIAHKIGLYGDTIYSGIPIEMSQHLENIAPGAGSCITYYQGNLDYIYYCQAGYRVFCGLIPSGNGYSGVFYAVGEDYNGMRMKRYTPRTGNTTVYYFNIQNGIGSGASQNFSTIPNPLPAIVFSNDNERNQYINNIKSGTQKPPIYSPDLIGGEGNLTGEYSNQDGYSVPDMLPQVDTSTEAGKPLRLQDWLNFANQANTNTGAGQPDLNKDLFDDIMDRIRGLIPSIPDPGPDPGGQTRPVPTPTPVPDPDYDTPQPEQPEWQSETTQQTEEVPDSIPTGKPWVVEGLQNKFPFCIPWDIKNMLGKFSSASRQAPYISWRFNPPFTPIDYTFQIDLADFEDAAAILRTLELIAFIVGLAFATRYLIGAT